MAAGERGFHNMPKDVQREIASKGGKAAHQKGTAHQWTSQEAREAGRKGGSAMQRKKREREAQEADTTTTTTGTDSDGQE